MQIIRFTHTIYAFFLFVVSFLFLSPIFLVLSLNNKWHHWAYKLNHLWALFYFPMSFFRTDVQFVGARPGKKPVVYCANHFSTIDIPSLALLPKQACYVGKESISKVPLFGYMFRKIHITVDRNSFKDRGRVYQKYAAAIKEGKSLFIYPEGGIASTLIPEQAKYKEGAFKIAIEQSVPIVPISITNNYNVLPDGDWLLKGNYIKLVVHEPIDTTNLTIEDVPALKEKVKSVIQDRINSENNIISEKQKLEPV